MGMDEQLEIVRTRGGERRLKRMAWERVLVAARASGLGPTAFARQHGLPVKRLLKWRSKLRGECTALPAPSGSAERPPSVLLGEHVPPPSFIELSPVSSEDRIEIRLGSAQILLPGHHSLSGVLRAVKEALC